MTNSRETDAGEVIWRRRQCLSCKKIFSTYEKIALDFLVVIKRNKKHVRYLRHKLFASIYDAGAGGKHVDRGDAAARAEEIVQAIEKYIVERSIKEITTSALVDLVTAELEKVDLGACYRYAAFAPHRGMRFGI